MHVESAGDPYWKDFFTVGATTNKTVFVVDDDDDPFMALLDDNVRVYLMVAGVVEEASDISMVASTVGSIIHDIFWYRNKWKNGVIVSKAWQILL